MSNQKLSKTNLNEFNKLIRQEVLNRASESYQKFQETFFDTRCTKQIDTPGIQQENVSQGPLLKL